MSNTTYADVRQTYAFYAEQFLKPLLAEVKIPQEQAALQAIEQTLQQRVSYEKTGAPVSQGDSGGVLPAPTTYAPEALLSLTVGTVVQQINAILRNAGQDMPMASGTTTPIASVVGYFYQGADPAVRQQAIDQAKEAGLGATAWLKAFAKAGVESGTKLPAPALVLATAEAWDGGVSPGTFPELKLFVPSVTGDSLDFLTAVYVGSFGRAPENDGLRYWARELVDLKAQGLDSRDALVAVTGRIYDAGYKGGTGTETGGNLSHTDYVAQLYQNVLGRDVTSSSASAADVAGWKYWVQELNSGVERSTFLHRFLEAALGKDNPDHGFIQARVLVAKYAAQESVTGEGKAPTDLKALIHDVKDVPTALAAVTKLLEGGFGAATASAARSLFEDHADLGFLFADVAEEAAVADTADAQADGDVVLVGQAGLDENAWVV